MIKKTRSIFCAMILALGVTALPSMAADSAVQGVLAPETFAVLAKQISAAVVNISTEKVMKRPSTTRRMPGMPGPALALAGLVAPPLSARRIPLRIFLRDILAICPRSLKAAVWAQDLSSIGMASLLPTTM